MALMFAHGELEPMPGCAIFADTGDESKATYEWLSYLEKQLPFPILTVSRGIKLRKKATTVRTSKNGNRYCKPALPVFMNGTLNVSTDRGKGLRHCTYDFKISLITSKLRDLRGSENVTQYMGISLDESHRMKPHPESWCANEFPLVFTKRMRREDCLNWMVKHGYPEPPRSSCIYCPMHSDHEWKRLKDNSPAEFAEVVQFEKDLQIAYADTDFHGVPFLHRECIPISEVDFDPNRDQIDMFGNECEGLCGV